MEPNECTHLNSFYDALCYLFIKLLHCITYMCVNSNPVHVELISLSAFPADFDSIFSL